MSITLYLSCDAHKENGGSQNCHLLNFDAKIKTKLARQNCDANIASTVVIEPNL